MKEIKRKMEKNLGKEIFKGIILWAISRCSSPFIWCSRHGISNCSIKDYQKRILLVSGISFSIPLLALYILFWAHSSSAFGKPFIYTPKCTPSHPPTHPHLISRLSSRVHIVCSWVRWVRIYREWWMFIIICLCFIF